MNTLKSTYGFTIAIIIFSALVDGCGPENSSMMPSGRLIWIQNANTIYQWDSRTGKEGPLLKLPYGTAITSLGKLSSKSLLFSAFHTPVGKSVNPNSIISHIYVLNIETKQIKELRTGLAPTYVNYRHKLFFLGQETGLFEANLRDLSSASNVKKIHTSGIILVGEMPGSVIQVSPYRVIYDYDPVNNSHQILEYNIRTGKWTTLPLSDCSPILWRMATKQLLCTKGDSFNYYLTDLRGDHVKKMGKLKSVGFFLYVPERDAAFAIRPGSFFPPERNDIWIYYFKTGKWALVLKNAGSALGAAVWIEDKK